MKIKIAATTDIGKERTNNEDTFTLCPDLARQDWEQDAASAYIPLGQYGSLLAVADGMGGANAGEVASAIAMKAVRAAFNADDVKAHVVHGSFEELLRKAVSQADEAIGRRIGDDPDTVGMGTTIVLCWIVGTTAYIAWCGDSRCYVYSAAGGLSRLTKDHSYVQQLVDSGEIKAREAFTHPDNNIITRGLGDVDCEAEPDTVSRTLSPGDTLLLCTDGLCGYCRDSDIERVLDRCSADTAACRDALVAMALDTGGYDNVCVAMASVIADSQTAPPLPTAMQRLRRRISRVF